MIERFLFYGIDFFADGFPIGEKLELSISILAYSADSGLIVLDSAIMIAAGALHCIILERFEKEAGLHEEIKKLKY
jgi:hypothetical protein